MEARVTEGAEGDTYLTVTRSRQVGGFEAEDIRLLQLLLPHLRGAQRTGRRLAAATIEREGVLSALDVLSDGVLILDAGRRVLYANPSAEVILRAADGLVADHGFLRAVARADDAALRQALAGASAEGGRALAVGRPSGRLAFVVTVQPLITNHLPAGGVWQAARIPAAMVFVVDPEDRSGVAATHALRGAYGLTVAEAAAANAVARGLGAKDAARALNVAPSTLRWHLRQVFEKTGTERQAELASLVVRLGTIAASS
jgi:DNA-binding CsgD family transcriptional regulator/PAS domain-containing protein